MAFSRDGRYLSVFGKIDNELYHLWDGLTGAPILDESASWSKDALHRTKSRRLDGDGWLRLFAPPYTRLLWIPHEYRNSKVAYSADNRAFAIGCDSGRVLFIRREL